MYSQQLTPMSRMSAKQRAFQSLPRSLRRRTASHNAKRIPKRLRARAEKEMAVDNTPVIHAKKLKAYARVKQMAIERKLQRSKEVYKDLEKGEGFGPTGIYNRAGTNQLAVPPPGKSMYQHRQKNKTWLPTHVWHAKRAHLETKWGFSVVKTPTAKSYRPTHRASTIAGAVAWDTSFYSTIILESNSIESLKAALAKITQCRMPGSQRYIAASRCWEGMMYDSSSLLGPGLVYWCFREADDISSPLRVIVRTHPSCFSSLFDYLTSIRASMSGGDSFNINDCRFTIGSIRITGPSSLPSLTSVLKLPDSSSPALKRVWKSLGSIANAASLPRNVVVALEAKDPRFLYPPQPARKAKETELIELTTEWPEKEVVNPSPLFTPDGVNKSYVNQSSQKEVDRRKRSAGPGVQVASLESDPTIPFIIMKHTDNSLTVLLPWGWVMPVWHSLMHINDVHLGGTDQSHQIALESGRPHFPDDFPATRAGTIAEHEKGEDRKKSWSGKPPGKRAPYYRLKLRRGEIRGEIGSPFRCDWQYLYECEMKLPHVPRDIIDERTQKVITVVAAEKVTEEVTGEVEENAEVVEHGDAEEDAEMAEVDDATKKPDQQEIAASPMELDVPEKAISKKSKSSSKGKGKGKSNSKKIKHTTAETKVYTPPNLPCHVSFSNANVNVNVNVNATSPFQTIQTTLVKVRFLHRGSPSSGARIYSLPPNERDQWLKALKTKQTALEGFPECPPKQYLVGFVSTGSFNLKEGTGFGIGAVLSRVLVENSDGSIGSIGSGSGSGSGYGGCYCLVRNVGAATTRIAKCEKVDLV